MTTLTKVASTISDSLYNLKEKVCNDGQFCDDVAMSLLACVTLWMMIEAMRPLY